MPSSSSSSSSLSRSSAAIETEFKSFSVFVSDAKKLRNVETFGRLDPYVIVKCGKDKVISPVFNNAGCDPTFNLHFRLHYSGQKHITFTVKDKKTLGRDKECGRHKLCLKDAGSSVSRKLRHHSVWLKSGEKDSGLLNLSIRFHKESIDKPGVMKYTPEASVDHSAEAKIDPQHNFKSIRLSVLQARNLRDTAKVSKIDPYVVVSIGSHTIKSEIMKNAGVNPKIRTSFHLPYESKRYLNVNFFDGELLTKDHPVGSVKIDLLPFFSCADAIRSRQSKGGRMTLALKGLDSAVGGCMDCRVDFLEEAIVKPTVTLMKRHGHDGSSSSSSSSF